MNASVHRGHGEAGGEEASACPSDQRLSPLEPGKETGILLHKEAPGPVSGARLRPSLSHGTVDNSWKSSCRSACFRGISVSWVWVFPGVRVSHDFSRSGARCGSDAVENLNFSNFLKQFGFCSERQRMYWPVSSVP